MTAWILGRPFSPSLWLSSRGTRMKVPAPVGSGFRTALNLTIGPILCRDRRTSGKRTRVGRWRVAHKCRVEGESEEAVRGCSLCRSLRVHGGGSQSIVIPLPGVEPPEEDAKRGDHLCRG